MCDVHKKYVNGNETFFKYSIKIGASLFIYFIENKFPIDRIFSVAGKKVTNFLSGFVSLVVAGQ